MTSYRLIKIVFPQKHVSNNLVNIASFKIILPNPNTTIYETVDFYNDKKFIKLKSEYIQLEHSIKLRNIINLHNTTGIKDISQITSMITHIKTGGNILTPNRIPNIKLVRSIENKWILFDGHHSLLAYMIVGKRFLNEVPHLIVENENGCVSDKDILVFFGMHSNKIENSKWKKFVINWQAPIKKQLSKRVQQNMGEVFDSLKDYSDFTKIS